MQTKYEMTGRIVKIGEIQTFTSGFQKREFVLSDEAEKYPQEIKFDVVKQQCDQLEKYKVGGIIKVHFNLRGNEYNGKNYSSLQAWKIEEGQDTPAVATESQESFHDTDDIPF